MIDGEAIIINLTTGVYYSMDGVGGRIWSLLESQHAVEEVAALIGSEYGVEAERSKGDVLQLAAQLFEEGLVLESDQEAATGTPGAAVEGRLNYQAPELRIYRDMGDLLALDPPVPGLEPIPWEDPAGR